MAVYSLLAWLTNQQIAKYFRSPCHHHQELSVRMTRIDSSNSLRSLSGLAGGIYQGFY